MGVGRWEEGGHFYLVTKESHTIVLFSALGLWGGWALYLPEGLRSLWQPHIWAPESRCAVSRSHSRTMRQTLGSPAPAPTAGKKTRGSEREVKQEGGRRGLSGGGGRKSWKGTRNVDKKVERQEGGKHSVSSTRHQRKGREEYKR